MPVLAPVSEHQNGGACRLGIWISVGSDRDMTICAKIEPECQPSVSRNDTNLVYFLFLNVSEILHLSHRAPFNIC